MTVVGQVPGCGPAAVCGRAAAHAGSVAAETRGGARARRALHAGLRVAANTLVPVAPAAHLHYTQP